MIADQISQKPDQIDPKVQYFGGANYLSLSLNHHPDQIIKAPGIWSDLQELKEFREKYGSDKVVSSLSWFIDRFKDNIIGVTGTKGKSTTCSLIQHLLSSTPDHVSHYVGNTTGVSPYTLWSDIHWQPNKKEWIVIELSSFQLQDLGYNQISPHLSVITNYYLDHQDQHDGPQEYWNSKDQIFIHQNSNDSLVYTDPVVPRTCHPKELGSGINVDQEITQAVAKMFTLPLPGVHFVQNSSLALSALAMTQGHTTSSEILDYLDKHKDNLQTVLNLFKGLPHRQQVLLDREITNHSGTKIALRIIDDGYATEPDAVAAAIATFASSGENLWLVMCGIDKGGEFDNLKSQFTTYQAKIVGASLFGAIGQTISDLTGLKVSGEGLQRDQHVWQEDLVDWIQSRQSSTQLSILFSPGGSSFDEFKNYTERVNWFTQALLDTLGQFMQ
jgi:UDP-N-acetylmuramoylalanine--D-glutamate ligase